MLSKINRAIGTRAESVRRPGRMKFRLEVVTEAVVNAVAHRDYTDNGSVQVMLFADRLEVRNPGRLPPPLTLDKLREAHRSVPANPLLAESLYLAEYIERMGTGTLDMIRRCVEAGLPEPGVRRHRWIRDDGSSGRASHTRCRIIQKAGRWTPGSANGIGDRNRG